MNLLTMIADLRQERQGIDDAITTLERLAANSGQKRRGRPPAWMTNAKKATATTEPTTAKPKSGRKPQTQAQRTAQAKRMKAYWAKKKKADAKA